MQIAALLCSSGYFSAKFKQFCCIILQQAILKQVLFTVEIVCVVCVIRVGVGFYVRVGTPLNCSR